MTTVVSRPIRTTRPRRVAAGAAVGNHASDYTELTRRVKAAGLLERRPGFYAIRVALLAAAFAVATVLLVTLGHTWWQLLVAGLFGLLFTQVGFLAHDGAHRQMFTSGKRNEWVSRIIDNIVVVLRYVLLFHYVFWYDV